MIFKHRNNPWQFLFMLLGMAVIITHLVVGYVFPGIACIIAAISYTTVIVTGKKWVPVAWFISILLSYIAIDVVMYDPNGISAVCYKMYLASLLAISLGMIICIACTLLAKEACINDKIGVETKIKKIRAAASLFCLYTIPTVILIVGYAIYNVVKLNMSEYSHSLVIVGLISLTTMAILNFISYLGTTLFERRVLKDNDNFGSKR